MALPSLGGFEVTKPTDPSHIAGGCDHETAMQQAATAWIELLSYTSF
jgi:hypothetical protein